MGGAIEISLMCTQAGPKHHALQEKKKRIATTHTKVIRKISTPLSFACEWQYLARGVAGIQGPFYGGTGCFHRRKVIYGLSPFDEEISGK